jgi:hypothetical protein
VCQLQSKQKQQNARRVLVFSRTEGGLVYMATWTQADIDALKTAVSSGVLTVSFTGPPSRSITYQSLAEMRSLLAEMVADVEGEEGTRPRYRKAKFTKGFDE